MVSATEIQQAKAHLRLQAQAALRGLSSAQRAEGSERAVQSLKAQRAWREARSVLFYAPIQGELDLWPLVAARPASKVIALPRYDAETKSYMACLVQDLSRDLQVGYYGIREPAAHCSKAVLNQLDLVLVPGVAFDQHGRRLGRGKGFYDQLLATIPGVKCGVAFDEQIVDEVPVAPHDMAVNCILTPTRWLQF